MLSTLNLLPPEKKKALQNGLVLAYAQTMAILVCLTVVLVSAALLSVRMIVKNDYDSLQKQTSSESDNSTKIAENVKQINAFIKATDVLQRDFTPWVNVLDKINALIPDNVHLDNIHMDEGGDVKITGVADTRDQSLTFRKNLENAPFFKDVRSPFSNILQKQNVSLEFDMQYVPEANQ